MSAKTGEEFEFNDENYDLYDVDMSNNLPPENDAATAYLGAPWRMPTDEDFRAMEENCTTKWTKLHGVKGFLVSGSGAYMTHSVFLPAAGFGYGSGLSSPGSYGGYWSSTPSSDDSYLACHLCFYSGYSYFYRHYNDRNLGQSVRPLRDFAS